MKTCRPWRKRAPKLNCPIKQPRYCDIWRLDEAKAWHLALIKTDLLSRRFKRGALRYDSFPLQGIVSLRSTRRQLLVVANLGVNYTEYCHEITDNLQACVSSGVALPHKLGN
jgi:hypothetical protein